MYRHGTNMGKRYIIINLLDVWSQGQYQKIESLVSILTVLIISLISTSPLPYERVSRLIPVRSLIVLSPGR